MIKLVVDRIPKDNDDLETRYWALIEATRKRQVWAQYSHRNGLAKPAVVKSYDDHIELYILFDTEEEAALFRLTHL